jgi:predicted transcriptional regulator
VSVAWTPGPDEPATWSDALEQDRQAMVEIGYSELDIQKELSRQLASLRAGRLASERVRQAEADAYLGLNGNGKHAEPSKPAEPYELVDADDLHLLPSPDWLLEPFILDKSLNVLVGPSGGGKSFLTLDWSACLGAGIPWFGQHAKLTRVAYIAAEGTGGLLKRRDAWKSARRVERMVNVTFLPRAVNLLDIHSVSRLITSLADGAYGLVVIDTMARCMIGGDENTSKDVGQVIDNIDHIKRTLDTSILLVHHTGWDEQRERGSTALRGASDIVLALRPDGTTIKLDSLKAKDSEPFATYRMYLRPEGKSAAISLGSNPSQIGAAELSLLETLPAAFGSNRVATSTLLQASGLPQRTFYRSLKSLVDRGYFGQDKDGRSTLNFITQQGRDAITANDCQLLPSAAGITATTVAPPLGATRGSNDPNAYPDEEQGELG